MSEANNSNLTLESLIIGDPMSQHHGVKCCPAIRENTDERYIVKVLSIPASQVQLDALLLTGAYPTPAHAMEYFHERAEEVLKEVEILNRLHAMEGFLPFVHAEIRKSEDGVGYQVYLISPYKRSLERQMQLEPLTHLAAVNLGLDLCAALAICRRAGYLYIDLKPSNVYITPNQGYRISDLGFISLSSLKYASYPEQYRSCYTAPEIADAMSAVSKGIDIYALGLILYQVYNNGELPATADGIVPPPAYADYEMAEIILKACDSDPSKRWADPLQMGQAIVSYMQRNSVNDTPIVPPPVVVPEEPVVEELEETTVTDAVEEADLTDDPGALLDSILAEIPAAPPRTAQLQELNAESEQIAIEETDSTTTESSEEAATTVEPEASEEAVAAAEPEVSEEIDSTEETLTSDDVLIIDKTDEAEDDLDLSFVVDLTNDETAPSEESAADIKIDLVSDEVQEMLARADELICHELPEPAVAPEPIDVPFPAPILILDDEEDEESVAVPPEDADTLSLEDETIEEPAPTTVETENEIDDTTEDESNVHPAAWLTNHADLNVSEYYSEGKNHKVVNTKLRRNILIIASSVILLAALIIGGILFYQHYYLQSVNSFTINGSVDSLTAVIDSNIKDELLTVICTDTYGNTRNQGVINGRAHFTNLTPSTQYRIELRINGFHKLDGIVSGSYTTDAQTEILNFNAVAGPDDGSVILSFSVNGPDSGNWTVAYSTGNTPETTLSFTGHTVTITDLMVGSEYLFRLIPNEDQYLTGTWLLHYTAQQIVYAQELAIQSCNGGTLVAAWNIPEGYSGQSWNVRCYNDNGFSQTLTTTDSQATFSGLDHTYGYTVEVTAVGMTQSASASVSANPITLTSISAKPAEDNVLNLIWDYTGSIPAEGWILDYTINGGAPTTISCSENTATVTLYPGSLYEFDIRPVGEITCFGKHLSYESEKAATFSNYGVTADDMSFYMCVTPKKENWDRFDVPAKDYKTSFEVGVKASFLVELWETSKKSQDEITVMFIIRTEDGIPVSLNSYKSTWNKLWNKKFCELDIPQMPEATGDYTVEIYFNGQQITEEAFSII